MKTTCIDGLHFWGEFQEDRRIDFNGFFWEANNGWLIDPMPLDDTELAFVRDHGGAGRVLVTNADHLRAAAELKERLGAELIAPAGDRERFGDAPVDTWVDELPMQIAGLSLHIIGNGKSPVELAVHMPAIGALYFGDLIRSHRSGKLNLLPDEKIADKKQVLTDIAALDTLEFDSILLGDGDPILRDGRGAWDELLDGVRS